MIGSAPTVLLGFAALCAVWCVMLGCIWMIVAPALRRPEAVAVAEAGGRDGWDLERSFSQIRSLEPGLREGEWGDVLTLVVGDELGEGVGEAFWLVRYPDGEVEWVDASPAHRCEVSR